MTTPPLRPLGHSGIEVSSVGLGCNNFGRRLDRDQTRTVLDSAISHGITFLDTADRYGDTLSEEYMGEVLKGRYDEVVLATKFGLDLGDGWDGPRGRRDYIHHAVDNSLRRLQTEVIDLYWYHQPDGVTPIEETLAALHELVTAGKVRAIGASNFSAQQLRDADAAARDNGLTRFTALQNEYSLLVREPEAELLPLCLELDVAFIPYFPLANGLLTGKYTRGADAPVGTRLAAKDEVATPDQWETVEKLSDYAQQHGISMTELAIGALLAQPAVASVIAGATKPEQIAANAQAGSWVPSDADRAELSELLG
jgi:aryl-alcohol dehydrogenase-like predicted oxidoreductase